MRNGALRDKSYQFAVRIVNMHKFLTEDKREFIISKQVLRSGTAIGALVMEAVQAQSRADFISKLSIALKEASETSYWLNLLKESQLINQKSYDSMQHDCEELLKMLTASIKTAKKNRLEKE